MSEASPHSWRGHWRARAAPHPRKQGLADGGPARPRSAPWGSPRGSGSEASNAFRLRRGWPPSLLLHGIPAPQPQWRLTGRLKQGPQIWPRPGPRENGGSSCRWEGSQPALPLPIRQPGLNAAAASAPSSRLAVPTSGTLPEPLPVPAAREAPPVGSALRPRLRVVQQVQVSQRAWGR